VDFRRALPTRLVERREGLTKSPSDSGGISRTRELDFDRSPSSGNVTALLEPIVPLRMGHEKQIYSRLTLWFAVEKTILLPAANPRGAQPDGLLHGTAFA
jgi:hypothetical protein